MKTDIFGLPSPSHAYALALAAIFWRSHFDDLFRVLCDFLEAHGPAPFILSKYLLAGCVLAVVLTFGFMLVASLATTDCGIDNSPDYPNSRSQAACTRW